METKHKIVNIVELKEQLAQQRAQGKTISFTNGCFDLVHFGHISYLQEAKRENRILIIGLNSDVSVKVIKGPQRPIIPEFERAALLAALECIDYVILFDQETPYDLIKEVQPDVLIKGADWKGKGVVGSDIVEDRGGCVEYVEYLQGLSTTEIIGKIQELGKE